MSNYDSPKKILFLFTVNYPFSHGEHFLEGELSHLLEKFEKIVIVCNDIKSKQNYFPPAEIKVIRYRPQLSFFSKLTSFLKIFDIEFWRECQIIKKTYYRCLSLSVIKKMVITLVNRDQTVQFIEKIIRSNQLLDHKLTLYSWWTTTITLGFAKIKQKYPKIKAMSRIHAVDLYFERNSLDYLPFRKYLYEHLDAIFFISNQGKKYFIDKLNIDNNEEKLIVSRIGTINHEKINFSKNGRHAYRLVSCSDLIPLKRVHLLIEALALIDDLSLEWVHFGKGKLAVNLQELARQKLGKKQNIHYNFMGYVNNKQLMSYYKENPIDVFINVSDTEGTPVSIMEANSFGIPAIATDIGGVSELVNSETGFLLPVDTTAEQIAQSIRYFINLPVKIRENYSQKAYEFWNAHYNADINFGKIAEKIASLTN